MELKDNFTNRYFKPDLVQKQVDMIKEPGATDALAEGFQRYGNLPANNAYAQLDNMTMAGVGDGMKATANDKRQEQLDPILKMTGQINAQNAYLEAQMQEQQERTMQTQQFVKNQAKWQAAQIWCKRQGIKFRVLSEKDLFHQGGVK